MEHAITKENWKQADINVDSLWLIKERKNRGLSSTKE